MCGIAISLDKATFIDILTKNQAARGGIAHSVMLLDRYGDKVNVRDVRRSRMMFNPNPSLLADASVYIGHTQAPTGGLSQSENRLHPVQVNDFYLYHNGILKRRYLTANGGADQWDSELLMRKYMQGRLDDIDGSFACVFVDDDFGDVEIFRNDTAPLYISPKLDVSSIPLNSDYKMIDAGVIWRLNFATLQLEAEGVFNNNDKFFK